MKNCKLSLLVLLIAAITFSGCSKNDSTPTSNWKGNACLVNFGVFGSTPGDVSDFNTNTSELINGAYSTINSPLTSGGNIQYIYEYGNSIYLLTNTADKLFWVDKNTFVQSNNGIPLDKPRYCVGSGNYLWISCWGADPYTAKAANAYLAKFNISTGTVEEKIALPGGPEGLALVNGKIYAALAYSKQVAVVDITSNAVSYIAMPAVSSYLVSDKNNNLYVSLVSTYSDPSDLTGLGQINTTTNTLDIYYQLDNISSNYNQMMSANKDASKIFVVAGAPNANYVLEGGIQVFDTSTKQFSPFVSGLTGVNGVAVDPSNNNVYCFISQNPVAAGSLIIYNSMGVAQKTLSTGISPTRLLFK